MKIARYWEKQTLSESSPDGQTMKATCWGWSATDVEQARQRARESARRVLSFLTNGEFVDVPNHYGYDERPPREEIIDEFADDNQETTATVTRNSYGCLILNTSELMFIDVDFPRRSATIAMPRFLRKLLRQTEPPSVEEKVLEKLRETAKEHSQYGYRIYRTRNGYRIMVHTHAVRSDSQQADQLLEAFDADPLYRRLCKNQECFRARLTPKPYRCQLPNPPCRFPFESAQQSVKFERWDANYRRKTEKYSTCRYVETIGLDRCDENLRGLVELHDGLTKATIGDPLA